MHEEPPFCSAACPLKLDVREFVRLCAAGDFTAARAMLERITPFARVLAAGCSAPCAAACRLNEVGEGIDIAALERAAMRYGAPKSGRGMLRFRKKKRAAVLGAERAVYPFCRGGVRAKKLPHRILCAAGRCRRLGARLRTLFERRGLRGPRRRASRPWT